MPDANMSPTERAALFEADAKCPRCRLNWWLFPPVPIHGSDRLRRCVECKDVFTFDPDGRLVLADGAPNAPHP